MDVLHIDALELCNGYQEKEFNPCASTVRQAKQLPCDGCWRRSRCTEACKRFDQYVSTGK